MDDETRILIDKIGIVGGLCLMVLALIGELLGWWDDVGLIVGALGMGWSLVSALDVNGREAVMILRPMPATLDALGDGQERLLRTQDQMLDGQDRMLHGQHQMLDGQNHMLDKQDRIVTGQAEMVETGRGLLDVSTRVLTVHERILARQDATVAALDRITDILDERLGI